MGGDERGDASDYGANMSEMQGVEWVQDMLPGMEDCEFGCFPMDHGIFEYGDDDERILCRDGNRGRG